MASIWENKKQKGNGIFSPPFKKTAEIVGVIGRTGFVAKLFQYSYKKLLKLFEFFCLEKTSQFFCFQKLNLKKKKVFCSTGKIVQPVSDTKLLTLLCCGWAWDSKQTWEEDKAFQGFLTSWALSCEELLPWDPEGHFFLLGSLLFLMLPWPWMPSVQSWYSHRMKNPTPALHKLLLGGIQLTWLQMSPLERSSASFHSQWRAITSFRTPFSDPSWSDKLSLL